MPPSGAASAPSASINTSACCTRVEEQRRQRRIASLKKRFCTLIPADGSSLLDTTEQIGKRFQRLDEFEDVLLIKTLEKNVCQNACLSHIPHNVFLYHALQIHLQPLSTATEEGKMVATYFNNTHTSRKRSQTLRHLWKLERDEEEQRFEPWKTSSNRKLLWHGSHLFKWVRILSRGLQIPNENGGDLKFGKGIYFADMISEGARHSKIDIGAKTGGLLVLGEVALGTPSERDKADVNFEKLPMGTDSIYGRGEFMHDPSEDLMLTSGVVVPTGTPITRSYDRERSLTYNEFVVYDVTRVKLKYLLHVDEKSTIPD